MNFLTRSIGWLFGGNTLGLTNAYNTKPNGWLYSDRGWGDGLSGGGVTVNGIPLGTLAGSAEAPLCISAAWACLDLLQRLLSSMPIFVYEGPASNRVIARNSRLYSLLHDSPNALQTPRVFWSYIWMSRWMRGNGYARIVRDDTGEAIALFPLDPDRMGVRLLDTGDAVYEYRKDEQTLQVLAAQNVLHVQGMGNGIVGLSPFDHMRAAVGIALDAQSHISTSMRRGGRRPGILQVDKVLNPQQREAVRANFRDIAESQERGLHILEAGFKFEPLGMTSADVQLLETRRFQVEDIARYFGVPGVLINDTTRTTSWGTGVQEIIDGFYKSTLGPEAVSLQQIIHKRVFTDAQRAKYTAEASFEALLRVNIKDRMQVYVQAVSNGIMTRNECRALENDPPLPGGDALTAQINLAPLDMLGKFSQQPSTSPKVMTNGTQNA